MKQQFDDFIRKNKLFVSADKILLAVSGGRDSVVLTHLFHISNYNFGIAHCNFGLRGEESDKDEIFVKTLAEKYKVSFYTTRFNTSEFASTEGISIQMAARDLRYNWFDTIRKKNKYNYVAFAHHADDVAETLLINLVRGTGISGLHGIPVKRGNIIRPMLFAMGSEIENFVKLNKLNFREDSSNVSDKYTRNKLRHHVIPVLKEINPSFNKAIETTVRNVTDVEQLLITELKKVAKKVLTHKKNILELSITELKKINPLRLFLHEFLKDAEFDSAIINDISGNIKKLKTGNQYFSATHRLLVDRNKLILVKRTSSSHESDFQIKKGTTAINRPLNLNCKTVTNSVKLSIPHTSTIACLDEAKLKFPLQLRKWKEGDRFNPLGMKGSKKLSNFFVDNKMSLIDKENQWLLASGNDIVWVIGRRIDERYKVTSKSGKVFVCELMDS